MSEVKEAVNGLKALLVQFQAMQKVSDVLDTIGNLEKAHSDAIVSINHYNGLVEKAKKEAESAESKLEVITQQVREVEAQKKKVLAETLSERQGIVNAIDKEKEKIAQSAKAKLEEIEAIVKSKKSEISRLDEEISRKENELEKMRLETTRLKNNLETFIGR